MCDPEGCSTVWGLWGGGGPPPPSEGGGGGPLPPPLVDPNPAPFPAGPVQARKHTKLTRCTVNGHCFAALQHFQSSIECCLEFAQRPLLPLVTNHRHICREAKGATDIYREREREREAKGGEGPQASESSSHSSRALLPVLLGRARFFGRAPCALVTRQNQKWQGGYITFFVLFSHF